MKKICASALIASLSSFACADTGYIKAQIGYLDTDVKTLGYTFNSEPEVVTFILGKNLGQYFAIEGFLSNGISKDDVRDSGYSAGFELQQDFSYGISAVVIAPVSDFARLYAKVGGAVINYDDTDNDSADASGLSYGVGVEANFTDRIGVNLEYVVYPDGEYDDYAIDVESNAISLGIQLTY